MCRHIGWDEFKNATARIGNVFDEDGAIEQHDKQV
jgi:hypothetical protein